MSRSLQRLYVKQSGFLQGRMHAGGARVSPGTRGVLNRPRSSDARGNISSMCIPAPSRP